QPFLGNKPSAVDTTLIHGKVADLRRESGYLGKVVATSNCGDSGLNVMGLLESGSDGSAGAGNEEVVQLNDDSAVDQARHRIWLKKLDLRAFAVHDEQRAVRHDFPHVLKCAGATDVDSVFDAVQGSEFGAVLPRG